jgi:hypothetical protein
VVQGLHPGVDVKEVRSGQSLRRAGIGRGGDPVARARQQLIAADAGERVFLRVEENVNQDTVLRRMLIRREVRGDVETARKPGEFPGIYVGGPDGLSPPLGRSVHAMFFVSTLDAPADA